MNEQSHWERVDDTKVRLREWWNTRAHRQTVGIVLVIIIPLLLVYFFTMSAPRLFPSESIVTVEEGATLSEIADMLEMRGVIKSPLMLRVLITLMGAESDVPAGDYLLQSPQSAITLARRLATGAYDLTPVRIRVPEGATVADMAIIFGKRLPTFDEEAFLEDAATLEGYLFPDTYFFLPNATHVTVMRTMLSNFETQIATIDEEIGAFGEPLEDIIIMASLLEKEASISEDRRKIADVLWKRLEINMALQVDATFVYFLGKNTFDLTLEDLQHESPYNTYRHRGLPPGPIANPGLDSILAAVTPEPNDYFFYLADHDGVTHYSVTYEGHLKKKRRYLD